ncbi:MAG: glycerol-3-phosphate acyltransferase, partial [Gemmatimonadales bacterium]
IVLALAPLAFLAVLVLWAVVVRLSGYVSLGSVIAAAAFPSADYLLQPARRAPSTLAIDLALVAFIVWKHRGNLERLLKGTESRFGSRGRNRGAPAAPDA